MFRYVNLVVILSLVTWVYSFPNTNDLAAVNGKMGCLEVQFPDEFFTASSSAMKKEVSGLLLTFLATGKLPKPNEFEEEFFRYRRSFISLFYGDEIFRKDGSLNFDHYFARGNAQLPEYSGKDLPAFYELAGICIFAIKAREDELPVRNPAERTVGDMDSCIMGQVTKKCQQDNRKIGPEYGLTTGIYSLDVPDKCPNLEVPDKIEDFMLQCLNLSLGTPGSEYKSDDDAFINILDFVINGATIEKAMSRPRKARTLAEMIAELKEIDHRLFTCFNQELKILNGIEFNITQQRVEMLSYEGWDPTVMEELRSTHKKCFDPISDARGIINIRNATDQSLYEDVLYGCFLTKFASSCGWNNDVVNLFVPFFHRKAAEKIWRHMFYTT